MGLVKEEGKEYEQCAICCDDIFYYAIGECAHPPACCWNCILRQRLKL